MRYFAHAVPGLGVVLAEEIAESADLRGKPASDGRNDVVVFDARGASPELRTAEDVFAQAGEVTGSHRVPALVNTLLDNEGLERALSVYASSVRPLRRRISYRVIARTRSEESFTRTEFRDALRRRVAGLRPKWSPDDPADVEIWAVEAGRTWRAGVRLTIGAQSRRTSRDAERVAALRPSVAATMVRLAGEPGRVLDPFCGAGTVLIEGLHAGWQVVGSDTDDDAIATARRNVRATLVRADAASLPFATHVFEACVSNLPWGKQYGVTRSLASSALRELVRVAVPGGVLVLLGSDVVARAVEAEARLTVEREIGIRLLGRRARLWKARVA